MKQLILLLVVFISLSACESKQKDNSPQTTTGESSMTGNPHQDTSTTASAVSADNVEPVEGGITIAELIQNQKKYDGQMVKVRGLVIKLNNMIMNRNWVHLKDGSLKGEKADLTVTTTDNVAIGDVVTVEGKIALNKDFGSGYTYEIIMEEAHVIK